MKQLTSTQVTVVQALALGATVTAAAKLASVSRPTIYKWQNDPVFSQALAYAKQEYAITMHDRIQALTAKAIDKLEEVLDNPKSSPAVLLKAALAILNRQNWALPCEDSKRIVREINAAADNMEANPEIMAEEDAYEKQLTDIYKNLDYSTTVKVGTGLQAGPSAAWEGCTTPKDKAA